jgi:hypothetical protein
MSAKINDLPIQCPIQCPICSISECLLPKYNQKESIRINNKGHILINMHSVAKNLSSYSRYNGGWIRRVDSLDLSFTDGRSIVGKRCENKKEWNRPGLYIDCSIDGSRQNQIMHHTLFELKTDGNVSEIVMIYDSDDWAVELWDLIEAYQNYNTPANRQLELC